MSDEDDRDKTALLPERAESPRSRPNTLTSQCACDRAAACSPRDLCSACSVSSYEAVTGARVDQMHHLPDSSKVQLLYS